MTLSHLATSLLLLPFLVGLQSRPAPESLAAPRYVTVLITSTGYDPPSLTVRHGDVVRFVQRDGPAHNIEFRSAPEGSSLAPDYPAPAGSVDVFHPTSPTARVGPFLIGEGRTYEVRIGEEMPEGVYAFGCSRHAAWRGQLMIDDSAELP